MPWADEVLRPGVRRTCDKAFFDTIGSGERTGFFEKNGEKALEILGFQPVLLLGNQKMEAKCCITK
jgi:hypothetical protein